jgi:putative endonuclease
MNTIGELGETIVLAWLNSQGGKVLQQRWRCIWGEIDIIALVNSETIAFVEVKTRSLRNWDEGGLLAVNPKKQSKLIKTASLFLAKSPQYSNLFCRFDVALVSYQKASANQALTQEIVLGKPVFYYGYQWILHQYLEAAFDL